MKRRKHRSQFEVIFSILFVIQKGNHRGTHIIYAANINQTSLTPKLNLLLKNGWIEERIITPKKQRGRGFIPPSKEPPSHSEYHVTAVGKDMIKAYHEFQGKVGDSFLCPLVDRRMIMSFQEARQLTRALASL